MRLRFSPARSRRRAKSQRGAAIISALLVVSLSAILVAGILWRQQVQVRRIENQRLIAQAQWVARGALDWTRLVLRSEADTTAGITYLGGVWAMPVAKTRLSDLLGQAGDAGDASLGTDTWISGSIEDAQARFNVRNLVTSAAPGALQLNVTAIEAFARLLSLLGLDGQLAKNAAVYLRSSLMDSATRFQMPNLPGAAGQPVQPPVGGAAGGNTYTNNPGLSDDGNNSSANAPLIMTSVDSLLDVPGFTPAVVARLRPFVTVLPTVTPINMNTASAEVIAATVPGLNVSSAQGLVARRKNVFFRNIGDVQLALQASGLPSQMTIDTTQFDVDSSYFLIHERVTHERAEVDRTVLVWRDPLTHTTRIVRVHDQ